MLSILFLASLCSACVSPHQTCHDFFFQALSQSLKCKNVAPKIRVHASVKNVHPKNHEERKNNRRILLIWISYRKHDHIMCASLSSQYSHVVSIASLENYSSRPSSLWFPRVSLLWLCLSSGLWHCSWRWLGGATERRRGRRR